jgi:hypothetical protein
LLRLDLIKNPSFLAEAAARARKLSRIEAMRKRPSKRPDWNELMKEIDVFRYGKVGKLKKVQCNDRSQPILTQTKIRGQVRFLILRAQQVLKLSV